MFVSACRRCLTALEPEECKDEDAVNTPARATGIPERRQTRRLSKDPGPFSCLAYLCLKGETNWQYWQLYLSSLLNSAMAEWLLSWDRSPCMDMKTRSHWLHGWPLAASLCFRCSSDTMARAAAMRAAARPWTAAVSTSAVSPSTSEEMAEAMAGPMAAPTGSSDCSSSSASISSPFVRLSEGNVRGTSMVSCCEILKKQTVSCCEIFKKQTPKMMIQCRQGDAKRRW